MKQLSLSREEIGTKIQLSSSITIGETTFEAGTILIIIGRQIINQKMILKLDSDHTVVLHISTGFTDYKLVEE